METQYSLFGIKTTNASVRWWLIVLSHVLFWSVFILVPYYLFQNNDPMRGPRPGPPLDLPSPQQRQAYFEAVFFFNNLLSVVLFYFNAAWLFPKFSRKSIGLYILLAIITIGLSLTLSYYFRVFSLGRPPRNFLQNSTFYFFVAVFAVSICYRLISDFQRNQRLSAERDKVRLQSELSFLRSQISPHFMFNLMNTLAALARKKSDLVEPMIVKMSDLLRYMLYDSDDSRIPIDREINYLESYINLQKMRFGTNVKIDTNFGISNPNLSIESMLLIPFVENAFKHGTGFIREPFIEIDLSSQANTLIFKVKNRYNDEFKETKDDASGIGLANVRRRLELLYPEKHSLKINEENGIFTSHLEINTQP